MGPPPPPGEEKIGLFDVAIDILSCSKLNSPVILKAVGGEIGSASALAPKLGPLGLVISA